MTEDQKRMLQLNIAQDSKGIMTAERIKVVLEQPAHLREPEDVDYLTESLKKSRFFKQRQNQIRHEDIKDLSNYLQFREMPKSKKVLTYGEYGSTYYIIIKGVCQVQVPNTAAVTDWHGKYRGQ